MRCSPQRCSVARASRRRPSGSSTTTTSSRSRFVPRAATCRAATAGLINPAHHGDSEAAIATYKVEPYVVAADVYTNPQHAGRGGWTWYTGAAGWMYRLALESLLGVHREVDRLRLDPLLPAGWQSFDIHYRYHQTLYHIHVRGPATGGRGVTSVVCDGAPQPEQTIPLRDDGGEHQVEVWLGDAWSA